MKWHVASALDLLLVDRGLVAEVEGFQRLHEREAGHGGAHRHVLAGLGGDLLGEHLLEEIAVGQFSRCGLLQQCLQPLPALEQAQLEQMLAETFQLGGVHATSSICSYTARSRTSTRMKDVGVGCRARRARAKAGARIARHCAGPMRGIDLQLMASGEHRMLGHHLAAMGDLPAWRPRAPRRPSCRSAATAPNSDWRRSPPASPRPPPAHGAALGRSSAGRACAPGLRLHARSARWAARGWCRARARQRPRSARPAVGR